MHYHLSFSEYSLLLKFKLWHELLTCWKEQDTTCGWSIFHGWENNITTWSWSHWRNLSSWQGTGLDDLQGSLPTQTILFFYKLIFSSFWKLGNKYAKHSTNKVSNPCIEFTVVIRDKSKAIWYFSFKAFCCWHETKSSATLQNCAFKIFPVDLTKRK